MTPFGRRMRELRAARGLRLKDMAVALNVSSAYLSALEHGKRGRPSSGFVQQISAYFNLAWDDVDELKRLAELSHPRIVVDTAGLSPKATELANRLAESIGDLSEATIDRLLAAIEGEGRLAGVRISTMDLMPSGTSRQKAIDSRGDAETR